MVMRGAAMLLGLMTVAMMLAAAYAFVRQGVLPSVAMLCSVFVAGLVAFNFWEPLAALLEPQVVGTTLFGYEDWFCLMALFSITLGALRMTVNTIAPNEVEYHPVIQQGGSLVCGLLTGYLAAGFLVCTFQTLPWHEQFMGFRPTVAEDDGGMRRAFPPDRVWLALMRRGSMVGFARPDEPGFDPNGSFELRYQRYRRYDDNRDALPYRGEDLPLEYGRKTP